MDPAVAALDIAKAGVILANMIESYLAGGAPPSNPEGAEHDDLQDRRSTSIAGSLHLHSSIDDGAGPLQPGKYRAPVQSGEQGTVSTAVVDQRRVDCAALCPGRRCACPGVINND